MEGEHGHSHSQSGSGDDDDNVNDDDDDEVIKSMWTSSFPHSGSYEEEDFCVFVLISNQGLRRKKKWRGMNRTSQLSF